MVAKMNIVGNPMHANFDGHHVGIFDDITVNGSFG